MATDQMETPAEQAADKRRGKSFSLVPDHRGAMINGSLYALYTVVCLVISLRQDSDTVWFFVFYFLTFLALFQGVTIVGRQCLHLFPKSTLKVEVVGKTIKVTRKNGKVEELTRDIDYTRRKSTLILQGKTHDNQAYSEVIREAAMAEGNLDTLASALKRFR